MDGISSCGVGAQLVVVVVAVVVRSVASDYGISDRNEIGAQGWSSILYKANG